MNRFFQQLSLEDPIDVFPKKSKRVQVSVFDKYYSKPIIELLSFFILFIFLQSIITSRAPKWLLQYE